MNAQTDGARRWYVTTAIPYVNASPHIGFAFEAVLTDALARAHRAFGEGVRFLTGTDDNSLKNAQAAEEEGVSTKELVERNAALFEALRTPLDLSFDDFIRTASDPRHLRGVEKFWKACQESGDIYSKPYRGLYCVGCELFYAEDELIHGLCPEHLVAPEVVEEENYFFRLSKYQDTLIELIESDRLRIVPQTRRNEVLSFIKSGLEDFSISRSRARARDWGIPVPGDDSQVVYVWFDALTNYITALGYADEGNLYKRFWIRGDERVHVIGKGIIRFHAVYWPAMLISAGVPLPNTIFVHGYLTIEGKKISKSLGNVIDPVALSGRFGTDTLRYYLLRKFPAADDGDFRIEALVRTHNSDLADQLGNLLSRVEGMLDRYFGGTVPSPGPQNELGKALIEKATAVPGKVKKAIESLAVHEAAAAVWEVIAEANRYVVAVEPWALARRRAEDPGAEEALSTCLYNLVELLRLLSGWTAPFIPVAARAIAEHLAIPQPEQPFAEVDWGGFPTGTRIVGGPALFPKLEIPWETC